MKKILDTNKYDCLCVVGDVHNDFSIFTEYLNKFNLKNVAFLCVGDFPRGLGTEKRQLVHEEKVKNLNNELIEYSSTLYVVRGNHDNPKFFEGNNDYSNIKFLPDYTVLSINEKNIFFLGGAISVDRKENIEGIDWYPDEGVKFNFDIIPKLHDIDIMITHTAPDGIFPFVHSTFVLKKFEFDSQLRTDLNIERHKMRQFYDALKIQCPSLKQYFYGHFHQDFNTYIGDCKFTLVGIGKILEIV
jgi:UDP-2,3-diacylglucosamine pyrophosphatase LpxH